MTLTQKQKNRPVEQNGSPEISPSIVTQLKDQRKDQEHSMQKRQCLQ